VGVHWGLYFEKDPEVLREIQRELSRLYQDGKIEPLVSETHRLDDAQTALRAMGSRKTTGKIVLIP
jgi:NADPH2:quinone reductase